MLQEKQKVEKERNQRPPFYQQSCQGNIPTWLSTEITILFPFCLHLGVKKKITIKIHGQRVINGIFPNNSIVGTHTFTFSLSFTWLLSILHFTFTTTVKGGALQQCMSVSLVVCSKRIVNIYQKIKTKRNYRRTEKKNEKTDGGINSYVQCIQFSLGNSGWQRFYICREIWFCDLKL